MILLALVGVQLYLIFVIAVALLFAQYWFSDSIALWGMHGHEVTPEQAPALHGAIDRLCALADMPKPRVAIADTDVPNAFATGRSPKPPWSAPRPASCAGSTSPRSRPCWPTSSPTSPTGTWPS